MVGSEDTTAGFDEVPAWRDEEGSTAGRGRSPERSGSIPVSPPTFAAANGIVCRWNQGWPFWNVFKNQHAGTIVQVHGFRADL